MVDGLKSSSRIAYDNDASVKQDLHKNCVGCTSVLSWYWEKVIMNECIKYYQNNQQVLSVRCRGVVGVTESRSLVEPGWSRS